MMGLIDLVVTSYRTVMVGAPFRDPNIIAAATGAFLIFGPLSITKWVRAFAVFSFAAALSIGVAALVVQPLDLTLTELRLTPGAFAIPAAELALGLGLAFWTMRELGRENVRDALASAGVPPWNARLSVQAGVGLVTMAALLRWLALHGRSGAVAASLAIQEMGPGYQYQLTSISHEGTTVSGVVTAWNDHEIRKIILHWIER